MRFRVVCFSDCGSISCRTEAATSVRRQNIQLHDTGGQSRQDAITFPSLPTLSLLIMFAQAGLREMMWKIQCVWEVGWICFSVVGGYGVSVCGG